MGSSISRSWNTIINIGITPELGNHETKYIRLMNGICLIASLWLLSLIFFCIPILPDSKYILLNSIVFPAAWTGVFILNYYRHYLAARLFFFACAMLCVTLNAVQLGRESENHLFFIILALISFYVFPKNQFKYILLVSVSSLLLFIGVEIFMANKGSFLNAPPEFFKLGRLFSMIALTIVTLLFTAYHYRSLNKAQEELEEAHKKSEKLLLNILPPSIAAKLKDDNSTIAERIDGATILFADIVDFTILSQNVAPEKLVELLNNLFSEFDNITQKFGLEKIKTIGDAYMVAGGVPERNDNHCELVARCGLEMLAAMNKGTGIQNGFRIRIGIHTGPVVAGVIGNTKFAYDLWGDSVNTASRMESHGEANKILVTKDVFLKLKERFVFEESRNINIKGKGNMETYFLNSMKEG